MDWSKKLYIFMLSAIIVMSGCFGTSSTDGQVIAPDNGDDGSGTTDGGTTVENNYYNTTNVVQPPLLLFAGSLNLTLNEQVAGSYKEVGNISISSGQALEIVSVWARSHALPTVSGEEGLVLLDSFDCFPSIIEINDSDGVIMPTDGNSCNYSIEILRDGSPTLTWSIFYRVHELG